MDPGLTLLPPFSQGHRRSDWGLVLLKSHVGKGKAVHVLSVKAVCGFVRWAECV